QRLGLAARPPSPTTGRASRDRRPRKGWRGATTGMFDTETEARERFDSVGSPGAGSLRTQHRSADAPRLVMLGRQGSGKGTQCVRLAADLGVVHLSTGEVFRRAVRAQTRL